MKSKSGKVVTWIAVIAGLTPVALAQTPVARGTTRNLSLLPGPTLLSPASGAPQPIESVVTVGASPGGITPAAGSWRFVRSTSGSTPERPSAVKGNISQSRGVLTLSSGSDAQGPSAPPVTRPMLSEPLRFDTKLTPVDTKLKRDLREAR